MVGALCLVLLLWLWGEQLRKVETSLNRDGRRLYALFVIAHPDDEAMFFSPLVDALAHMEHKISVLCLSTGNVYGLGSREKARAFLNNMRENFGVLVSCKDNRP